jgi:hypothetical protein
MHSIATRGPSTEAKAAIESKIAGYRAALADVQPLTNLHTKLVVLAFESSGWTDPEHSAEAGQRVGAAAAFGPRLALLRPILELGFPSPRGTLGVKVPVLG